MKYFIRKIKFSCSRRVDIRLVVVKLSAVNSN